MPRIDEMNADRHNNDQPRYATTLPCLPCAALRLQKQTATNRTVPALACLTAHGHAATNRIAHRLPYLATDRIKRTEHGAYKHCYACRAEQERAVPECTKQITACHALLRLNRHNQTSLRPNSLRLDMHRLPRIDMQRSAAPGHAKPNCAKPQIAFMRAIPATGVSSPRARAPPPLPGKAPRAVCSAASTPPDPVRRSSGSGSAH